MEPPRLAPRRVQFEFEPVPVHWVPGRPFLTHLLNALHFLFEHGERWFCKAFRAALPQIQDAQLRADVRGFIAQEATHSHHHAGFIGHLAAQGLHLPDFSRGLLRLLKRVRRRVTLRGQVAVIAGIEQYTAFLGAWVFEHGTLRDADPAMRELFLWHAAEEIEHKAVAFDLLQELRPGYFYRVGHFLLASLALFIAWGLALVLLLRRDRRASLRAVLVDFVRCVRDGSLPIGPVLRGCFSYLKPGFHPDQDDNLHLAENHFAGQG